MLNNKRMTIVADTVIDDTKIATYGAILDLVTGELSLTARNIDNEACKVNKDIVRADRAEFEDFAYMMQDMVKPAEELVEETV